MSDETYMQRALKLAENGLGKVAPNPLVGAVIVKNNKVIGEGWHERYKALHAERNALKHCIEDPSGATMYVTLEPCCHHGKQLPCVDAIIEAKIATVVVGSQDPNPVVSGKGIERLRQAGIHVKEGVLEQACQKINEAFFHYIRTKRPYVLLKYAMTMDGKISTRTGASKWISGEEARHHVHKTRHSYQAIMVGIGTILADNPSLTCRLPGGINPIRLICDTNLRMPLTAEVVRTAKIVPTWIVTSQVDRKKWLPYEALGCRMLAIQAKENKVDLVALMDYLGEEGINSILLEGGSTLNWAMLKEGLVQKVHTYIAPKFFGGKDAKSPIGGDGIALPNQAIGLKNTKVISLGKDFLLESEVMPCLQD